MGLVSGVYEGGFTVIWLLFRCWYWFRVGGCLIGWF